MTFRYDINGLRAIAVIAVVLFHFNPAWVPGGFAGVDVFFVISGFLMTGIIFRGLENDNFNLFQFYVARANRIIPALSVLCFVLLIFGWFYLTPLDYKVLGKHVASSMGFLSNVIYWRESGYFDTASHEKWLLHTWSLSVEWQFYIIYPIFLIALKKILSLENIKRLVVVGTILGFGLSVVATMKWPNPAYYLFPTRAWEMMMGGLAFLYPWHFSESKKKLAELIGLSLILASYAFVASDVPWPGHFALLPVLGAYLVIVANQQSSLVTNNKAFQYLGKWSYSIYIWHWPVAVLGYYFDVQNWVLYGLPLSIILGFVSFRFVESIKFKSFSVWLDIVRVKPIRYVIYIFTLSILVYSTNGLLFTQDTLVKNIVNTSQERTSSECFNQFKPCSIGEGENTTIVIGDSHALATVGALANAMEKSKVKFYGKGSCNTMLGDFYNKETDKCPSFNDFILNDIKGNSYPLIIINSGAYTSGGAHLLDDKNEISPIVVFDKSNRNYAEEFKEKYVDTICRFSKDREVFIFTPYPRLATSTLPNDMIMEYLQHGNIEEYTVPKSRYLNSHSLILSTQYEAKKKCGANVIDVSQVLCNDKACFGSFNKTPLYFDSNHLTLGGASYVISAIKDELPYQ